jgi:hypothetical protein
MDEIIISGKDLGALSLKSFCPRCFWLKMHCGKKLPYQIFPGIFSSIDSYSKKITNLHYEKAACIPHWLAPFGNVAKPVKTPHFTKFYTVDPKTKVHLRGVPDEIIQVKDGSYVILDYKTAKYTGAQDDLLPMYEVQLNSYAYIGNRGEFRPVTGIGLVYYEPVTDLTVAGMSKIIKADGFYMAFKSNIHHLKLDPDSMIPPLLQRVRDIVDMAKAPSRTNGCKDCDNLDRLIDLAR